MLISPNALASIIDAQVEAVMTRSEVDADTLYDILYASASDAMLTIEEGMTLAEKVGPSIWKDMHYRAKVADREGSKNLYDEYIENLSKTHPCLICRDHMQENLRIHPPSRYRSAFVHSVVLHNTVNLMLDKPTISFSEADQMYNIDCDSCSFSHPGKSSINDEQTKATAGTRAKDRPEIHQHSWGHPHDRAIRRPNTNRSNHGYYS